MIFKYFLCIIICHQGTTSFQRHPYHRHKAYRSCSPVAISRTVIIENN